MFVDIDGERRDVKELVIEALEETKNIFPLSCKEWIWSRKSWKMKRRKRR